MTKYSIVEQYQNIQDINSYSNAIIANPSSDIKPEQNTGTSQVS